jgi:hypothetical protein
MMTAMRPLLRIAAPTITVRVLAFLLALGVAAAPLLPQPRLHACQLAGLMSAAQPMAMADGCCCAGMAERPGAPAPHGPRAPDPGGCCQELAPDQHQPTALPAPEAIVARALPSVQLVEMLPPSRSHDRQFSGAACAAPYPDGPPAYLRWGGFLT